MLSDKLTDRRRVRGLRPQGVSAGGTPRYGFGVRFITRLIWPWIVPGAYLPVGPRQWRERVLSLPDWALDRVNASQHIPTGPTH